MKVTLTVEVPDEWAEPCRKHLARLATEDVRVSLYEFARRNGFRVRFVPGDGTEDKPDASRPRRAVHRRQ